VRPPVPKPEVGVHDDVLDDWVDAERNQACSPSRHAAAARFVARKACSVNE
jgi:hypothetical protein